MLQNGGDCIGIRWANEISAAGLFGLTGNPGTDVNWFHNSIGPCRFVDTRPGSPLSEGGPLATWQAQLQADLRSFSGAISVRSDGHLPPGSPAIGQGAALAQLSDDIVGQPRSGAVDIGADQVGSGLNDSDRVMNWAEIAYPQYFRRPYVAGTALGYTFRYYEATGNYLATRNGRVAVHNGRDWIELDVGALADFVPLAAAAGY